MTPLMLPFVPRLNMSIKLYYHKTSGGAEYLTDTFIPWTHNGKSGREGRITDETKICIRIDGDIEKDAEVITDYRADLLDALKTICRTVDTALLYGRIYKGVAEDITATIDAAIPQAEQSMLDAWINNVDIPQD